MKKSLIVLLMFVIALPCFAAKAKKSKKASKAKIEVTEDVSSDDTEIITREQIDTMFSLANQLNADMQAAIEDAEAGLDEIIAEEAGTLENASQLVELDGTLVYMIPTISKKESSTLIGNFLYKHPEFELVEEKQFFPFEAFDSCLYYARLKKVSE